MDLVKWEVWKWDEHGESTRHALPTSLEEIERGPLFPPDHPVVAELLPARTNLLENISMFSEELMETLLGLSSDPSAYLTVPTDKI